MSRSSPRKRDRPGVKGRLQKATLKCWFDSCFPTGKVSLAWGLPSWSMTLEVVQNLALEGTHQQRSHFCLVCLHSQLHVRTQPSCLGPQCPHKTVIIYQCPTAQQNHEDNEALKPTVFHYLVAGFPQVPPSDPGRLSLVHGTAWEAATQDCKEEAVALSLVPALSRINNPNSLSLPLCISLTFPFLPTEEVKSFANPLNLGSAV